MKKNQARCLDIAHELIDNILQEQDNKGKAKGKRKGRPQKYIGKEVDNTQKDITKSFISKS